MVPAMPQSTRHPRIKFKTGAHKRFRTGHPWVYSNEIEMDPPTKALPPGSVVTITDAGGGLLGTVHFNPHTLIAARVLGPPEIAIDQAFIAAKLQSALRLRQRLYDRPYYRLVHAEADGLPGLIVDRFGEVCVIQPNTAGMDSLNHDIAAALGDVVGARTVIMRGDSPSRAHEGLDKEVTTLTGSLDGPVTVEENGVTFFADLISGQKTGWFFDQRDNHAFMAGLCRDATVLDLFTHTGGFALPAARAGAKAVHGVDSSAPALALAAKGVAANNVVCTFEKAEVFPFLEAAIVRKAQWDIVIADPPPFVKSKKDQKAGMQGYRKLARLAAQVTAPGGILFMASCSHNAPADEFTTAVARGIDEAGRSGCIIRSAGASPDHPVHPMLPESAYLKAVVLQLD